MIIGFTGKMGTGKSTACNILEEYIGGTTRLKLAGTLYELQDIIYEKCGLTLEKEKDRQLLQYLGTEWGRKKDPNLWLNIFLSKAQELQQSGTIIICDDVRFPNEAERIRKEGGIIVKVIGPQRGNTIKSVNHESEQYIEDIKEDFTLFNGKEEILLELAIKNALVPYINKRL